MAESNMEGREKRIESGARDAKGRFLPGNKDVGVSPGRPPVIRHIRELAREQTEQAFSALLGIALNGENETARVAALKEVFDRGWGKSTQFFDTAEDSNIAALMAGLFGGQHALDIVRTRVSDDRDQ